MLISDERNVSETLGFVVLTPRVVVQRGGWESFSTMAGQQVLGKSGVLSVRGIRVLVFQRLQDCHIARAPGSQLAFNSDG